MLHFNDLKTEHLFKWSLDILQISPITCHTLAGNSEPFHSFISSARELFLKIYENACGQIPPLPFTYVQMERMLFNRLAVINTCLVFCTITITTTLIGLVLSTFLIIQPEFGQSCTGAFCDHMCK